MIKYPLYQFSINGETPFDVYKTAAHGDTILDAIEIQMESCYNDYENAVNSASVHNLSSHGFVDPEKEHLKKLYKSDCDIAKKYDCIIAHLQVLQKEFITTNVLIVHCLSLIQ